MQYHEPVLLEETIGFLKVEKGKRYVDCTLGDGGHTVEILKKGGKVLGIDSEEGSLERAMRRIEDLGLKDGFIGVLGNFRNIENLAGNCGFTQVDGILYDLGFSSSQLETGIGLSFQTDDPLDMRLDKSLEVTAADLLNALSERELEKMFFEYGNERYSRRFAKAIVDFRSLKRLETTKELAELLVATAPPGYENGRIHQATRVFQALRIAVNDEFGNLEHSLPRAARMLLPGGRMLVITFHSLEDKLVKEFGRSVRPGVCLITKKPVRPDQEEVDRNVRSRSAKMYVFERNA
ncbi:MAG: 16S rRNA (cytosine(1402)-N(4))-methyltransferase RsmH [Patescibacteria group bacterium]|jgi:16S rRNA (cytosine1402-N4)-methyltransferase